MKYIATGIVGAGVIIALVIWLRNTPKEAVVGMIEPTTPPPSVSVTEKPIEAKTSQAPQKTTKRVIENMTIETTTEGAGAGITNGQTAVVDSVGMLPDGSIFDASKRHGQPFTFSLPGQVIEGWNKGIVGMKVGEVRKLTIPPELAYGPNGYPPVIPPNATLIFEVTLLAIK